MRATMDVAILDFWDFFPTSDQFEAYNHVISRTNTSKISQLERKLLVFKVGALNLCVSQARDLLWLVEVVTRNVFKEFH